VAATTLYEQLSLPAEPAEEDRGRTEKTTAPETLDNDRAVVDLYGAVGDPVVVDGSVVGRTEETKTIETIDKDRADPALISSLTSAPADLYAALFRPACSGDDRGRTEVTEATETIDWDRPPELPPS
jgi:hypothetical protein